MCAALLVALGAAGSMLGAQTVARNDAQRSHQALVTSSMEIASTLKLTIQQENSLVISAEAYIVENPNASNTEFLSWVGTMRVAKRFPEVSGVGFTLSFGLANCPNLLLESSQIPRCRWRRGSLTRSHHREPAPSTASWMTSMEQWTGSSS